MFQVDLDMFKVTIKLLEQQTFFLTGKAKVTKKTKQQYVNWETFHMELFQIFWKDSWKTQVMELIFSKVSGRVFGLNVMKMPACETER